MGRDENIRSMVAGLPGPDLDTTPVTEAPPLEDARVAMVTTAGLRVGGRVELLGMGDPNFVEIPSSARNLQISHFSPNFDRVGFTVDLNVVFPIDRLLEREADGRIGSLNDRHLSFMGAQGELSTIMQDTGPAAAELLLDDGVDVVLLTPI